LVIALTLLGLAGPASAQQLVLRWIPSASSGVGGYRVYVGPAQDGPISATPINVGLPAPAASGVASASLTLDRTRSWVAEMTAYATSGAESARSNRVTIPALGETLGAPIYEVDFSAFPAGSDPSLYLDPSSAFQVSQFSDGNHAFGTSAPAGRVVSRYVGTAVTAAGAYELSGRLSLLVGADLAGVAVRVPSSDLSQYFALGVDTRGVFVLAQAGKAPLRCATSASTGVSPASSRWYRFKLRFTNPSGRARLRAKVWLGSSAEPAGWQADCWTDTVLSPGSGAFALYRDSAGVVYWDDLAVRPVTGTLDPIP
jgi:hypothetical protein